MRLLEGVLNRAENPRKHSSSDQLVVERLILLCTYPLQNT